MGYDSGHAEYVFRCQTIRGRSQSFWSLLQARIDDLVYALLEARDSMRDIRSHYVFGKRDP